MTKMFFKDFAKVAGVVIAAFVGELFDAEVLREKQFLGVFHFCFDEVFIGAYAYGL